MTVRVNRLSDPTEKLVQRQGCVVQGEVCEVVPAQFVQKVAEYRVYADDFLANIVPWPDHNFVTPSPVDLKEIVIEDVCALANTISFDARAVTNKVFDCGSIKIVGTVRFVYEDGTESQHSFHVRAVFQEVEPVAGVRPTDQVLEQLEFVEGADSCLVYATDPDTGEETQLLIFKASLIVEKRIFRCVLEDVPPCTVAETNTAL